MATSSESSKRSELRGMQIPPIVVDAEVEAFRICVDMQLLEKSMSKVDTGGCASGTPRNKIDIAVSNGAAKWLSRATTPVFAIMALLTMNEQSSIVGHGSSPLNSMALMYGLMAVFHAAPG